VPEVSNATILSECVAGCAAVGGLQDRIPRLYAELSANPPNQVITL
jgi:hypothetical protein